jgi:predicted SnoaL-like aldol condensation-catalyzing enzyme
MLKMLSAGADLLLTAGAAVAADAEANNAAALAFQAALTDTKDFVAAEKCLARDYKQHNAPLRDGAAGIQGLTDFFREKLPDARSEIRHIWTDGDYVILHVHFIGVPGAPGRAIADIYRMQDGKIAEHWDAVEDVPTTAADRNGMF